MSSTRVFFANVAARAFNPALFPATAVTFMCPLVSFVHLSLRRRVSCISLQNLSRLSRTERYGLSWLVSPTFRPLNLSPIYINSECSVKFIGASVFASMFVLSALVILAITCRREFFRSKYKSFALLTVNLMAMPVNLMVGLLRAEHIRG